MPNWCSNTLTVRGDKATVRALIERAASGDQDYFGPFNKKMKGEAHVDWEAFTPILMETLMQDDDLFNGKYTEGSNNKSPFCFHAFVPVPREVMLAPYDPNRFKEMQDKYPEWFSRFPNMIAGYDWENRNWGCKWGASDAHLISEGGSDEDYSVDYEFQTAWSPPMDFMHSLAMMYPTLKFSFSFREEGMGFEGDAEWENGGCIFIDERDCEPDDEEEGWEE